MKAPEIDMTDAVKGMTMVVRIRPASRVFKLRLAIGLFIVNIGAKIIGVGHFRVEDDR